MTDFLSLSPVSAFGDNDGTANKTTHASQHEALRAAANALLAAGQALETAEETDAGNVSTLTGEVAALTSSLTTLSNAFASAPIPTLRDRAAGLILNTPASGSPWYPHAACQRWKGSAAGLRQIMVLGDSLTQGYNPSGTPLDWWWKKLQRYLGYQWGPLVGYGYRGLWLSGGANPPANEWASNGSWTRISPTLAYDVAPFAEAYIATGSSTTHWTWTVPAGVTVQSFEIVWVDVAGGNQWSYKIDSGAAVNGPTPVGDNKLHRFQVNSPITSSVILRCGNAVGSTGEAAFAGIIPYSIANGWNGPGCVLHAMGRNGAGLAWVDPFGQQPLYRPASAGDSLAVLDLLSPDLVIAGFLNDANSAASTDTTAWSSAQDTLMARCGGYADVLWWSPWDGPTASDAIQQAYRTATKANAVTYGAGVFDVYDNLAMNGFVGNSGVAPLVFSADNTHENQAGHDWLADLFALALTLA